MRRGRWGCFQLPFIFNFFWSMKFGRKVGKNPWNATSSKWSAPSPPPAREFRGAGGVYRGPYEYSVPGHPVDFGAAGGPARAADKTPEHTATDRFSWKYLIQYRPGRNTGASITRRSASGSSWRRRSCFLAACFRRMFFCGSGGAGYWPHGLLNVRWVRSTRRC